MFRMIVFVRKTIKLKNALHRNGYEWKLKRALRNTPVNKGVRIRIGNPWRIVCVVMINRYFFMSQRDHGMNSFIPPNSVVPPFYTTCLDILFYQVILVSTKRFGPLNVVTLILGKRHTVQWNSDNTRCTNHSTGTATWTPNNSKRK